jgi:hypothetical protein
MILPDPRRGCDDVRIAWQGDDLIVVDDLLPEAVFAAVGREVARADFRSVHSRGWDRAWQHSDGMPWRGPPVYYDPTGTERDRAARYPTGTAVDAFLESVVSLARANPSVVGTAGVDWHAMFCAPWLYPPGSALTLHRDAGNFSGAFTYFVHPRWRVAWGGPLVVFDRATSPPSGDHRSHWLFDDTDEVDAGSGIATTVYPRPNRLALIGPDRPHLIGRVDANAGEHVRTSLAGFFLRPS